MFTFVVTYEKYIAVGILSWTHKLNPETGFDTYKKYCRDGWHAVLRSYAIDTSLIIPFIRSLELMNSEDATTFDFKPPFHPVHGALLKS